MKVIEGHLDPLRVSLATYICESTFKVDVAIGIRTRSPTPRSRTQLSIVEVLMPMNVGSMLLRIIICVGEIEIEAYLVKKSRKQVNMRWLTPASEVWRTVWEYG